MRILILEDNSDRQRVMRSMPADRCPQFDVEFFVSSGDMIERMCATGVDDVILYSLDHDLDSIPSGDGRMVDAGDGRDISRRLSRQVPRAPVIVHTTNTLAGDEMVEQLAASDWEVVRVIPYDGERWIREVWARAVRDAIVRNVGPTAELPHRSRAAPTGQD